VGPTRCRQRCCQVLQERQTGGGRFQQAPVGPVGASGLRAKVVVNAARASRPLPAGTCWPCWGQRAARAPPLTLTRKKERERRLPAALTSQQEGRRGGTCRGGDARRDRVRAQHARPTGGALSGAAWPSGPRAEPRGAGGAGGGGRSRRAARRGSRRSRGVCLRPQGSWVERRGGGAGAARGPGRARQAGRAARLPGCLAGYSGWLARSAACVKGRDKAAHGRRGGGEGAACGGAAGSAARAHGRARRARWPRPCVLRARDGGRRDANGCGARRGPGRAARAAERAVAPQRGRKARRNEASASWRWRGASRVALRAFAASRPLEETAVNRHVRDAIVQLQAGAQELIMSHEDFGDAGVKALATVLAWQPTRR
jgi:hypothetical protein